MLLREENMPLFIFSRLMIENEELAGLDNKESTLLAAILISSIVESYPDICPGQSLTHSLTQGQSSKCLVTK